MKIGLIEVKNKLFLAPMAGVTDLPFRKLCREYGAGVAVTEMVSAKAICYGDKKTALLLKTDEEDVPLGVQLFGSSPDILARAAKEIVTRYQADFIDINMGCPMPKIAGNGDGSALMKDPELIGRIVQAVKNAVELPVTVKLRSGFTADKLNAVQCALAAEAGGAAMVTIHGKTREQLYAPPVNLDIIAQVKAAVNIPVIGNGEVANGANALHMLMYTGCDGLMIGRGALGNPFLFEEISAALRGEGYTPPSLEERMRVAMRHIEGLAALKGEHIGLLEARKHFAWYLKGIKGASMLRAKINTLKTLEEARLIAEEAVASAGNGEGEPT